MRRAAARIGSVVVAAAALAVAAAVGVGPVASGSPAGASTAAGPVPTIRTEGYVRMSDGVELAYKVVRPARPGRYPALFEYSGYFPGRNPTATYVNRFVAGSGHYAYVGVNLRGTGCSSGTFDFFEPQQAEDGAAVIRWIRRQGWSDGKVGMVGKSFPGITQLFVAAQHPPGLEAIAPGHFFSDAYRDIARPGGIANHGFAALWSFIGRPSYEFLGGPQQVLEGDAGCLRASTAEVAGLPTNPYVQLLSHPYDDALFEARSPERLLPRLRDIPMLATLSWQDEQLASRQTDLLAQLDDAGATRWWATLTNGDHDMALTPAELDDLERFYDHFLRGVDDGWSRRPRVRVWWDAGRDGRRAPGWTTGLDHWSEARRRAAGTLSPLALPLRSGGRLGAGAAPAGDPPSTYAYVPSVGTQGPINPRYAYAQLPDQYLWSAATPAGTGAAFTSPPLDHDVTVLGSASADLWITATAPDVDLQVTITEVRPDGQEEYVEQGWLRASQRTLDPRRSTELRPYQTHAASDVRPLAPGTPVLARVEVFPFGHLFRAGSRIRMWVEAPVFLPALWAFTPSPLPAAVQVLHDPAHPSRLVLPEVPDDPQRVRSLPRCGSLIRQPCRPDPIGPLHPASLDTASTSSPGSPRAPGSDGGTGPAEDAGGGGGPASATGPAGPAPAASPATAIGDAASPAGGHLPATGVAVPLALVAALLGTALAAGRVARSGGHHLRSSEHFDAADRKG